ncbi:MAG: hypothetical protein FWF50_01770 [Defluviitaleaceae bacterium]|nr:hypothetical protein [Defluviitaleaceae bacterium]
MSNFLQLVLFLAVLFIAFFLFFLEGELDSVSILVYEKNLFSFTHGDSPSIHTSGRDIFFISSQGIFFYENLEKSWFYEHSLKAPISFYYNRTVYFADILGTVMYSANNTGILERIVYDYPIITFVAGTAVLAFSYGYRVERINSQFTLTEAIPTIISKRTENEFAISFLNIEEDLFSSVAFYNPELIGAVNFPRLVTGIYFIDHLALITFTDSVLAIDVSTRETLWQKEKELVSHTKDSIAIYNKGILNIFNTEGYLLSTTYANLTYLAGGDYFIFAEGNFFKAINKYGYLLWNHTSLHEVVSVHFIDGGVIFKTPIDIRIFNIRKGD